MESLSTSRSFISIDWLKPLAKALVPLAKELSRNREEHHQGQEQRLLELRKIDNLFGSPFDLAKYYIQPYCQQQNPAEYVIDRPVTMVTKALAFSTINAFLKGDLPPTHDGSHQMFLLAGSGIGKTSLLMMLKLSQIMGYWSQEYDCLFLKLGKDTLETMRNHPNQTNTILLLDALDEDPIAWNNVRERLLELLEASASYRRVIISCRTGFFPETVRDSSALSPGQVQFESYTCPLIFLSPFNDDQVHQYLAKRFPKPLRLFSNSKHKKIEDLISGMQALRFRPFLLAHLEDVLKSKASKNRMWNPYSFYLILIRGWLSQEEEKLRKELESPPTMKAMWQVCITVATYLQREGEHFLTHATLDQLARDDFPILANLEHFEAGIRSLLNRNANGDFHFAHYSIQEFLLAFHIVNGKPDNVSEHIRVTDQLLEFLHVPSGIDFAFLDRLHWGKRSGMPMPKLHFYDRLSNDEPGPAMQFIPAGEFSMGSPEGEGNKAEYPQHRVHIDAFALGTWPVTFEEYDYFCEATGRKKADDCGWGRERYPVQHVFWQDALAYCTWLSKKTGAKYRLPSEAEWEYAARAGTETPYWWGNEPSNRYANCNTSVSKWKGQTSPVGAFPPNPFGLYDMVGNLWEWTSDCWHKDYRGAPIDGSPWGKEDDGNCSRRVFRGSSWNLDPKNLRSALRGWGTTSGANSYIGFRIVREL